MPSLKSPTLLLASLLTLLLPLAGSARETASPTTSITSLPEDSSIIAHAPTLKALIAQTKPTLTFQDAYNKTILLWTGTIATGQRFFRLATAQPYQPKNGPLQWILLRAQWPVSENNILPQTTILAGTHRPKWPQMSTTNWAREITPDPKGPNLYEIEYYYQLSGEAAQGWRLILMKSPAAKWQFVANLPGDFWDDTGTQNETKISARWTKNFAAPLHLVSTWIERNDDVDTGKQTTPSFTTHQTYTGKLPFTSPTTREDFLTVAPGETFSGIIATLIDPDLLETPSVPAAKKALAAAILKLNPTLKPNHLQTGQTLRIPTPAQRDARQNSLSPR